LQTVTTLWLIQAHLTRKIIYMSCTGQRKMTFLNIPQLERQGADVQSKVDELEEISQSLRSRDKLKDDAISQLSDQ
jgi:hypothetical protein